MAQKISEELRLKFSEITKLKYVDQAKWFLNGFWKVDFIVFVFFGINSLFKGWC